MKRYVLPLFVLCGVQAYGAEVARVARYSVAYRIDTGDPDAAAIPRCIGNHLFPLRDTLAVNETPDFHVRLEVEKYGSKYIVSWSVSDALRSEYWASRLQPEYRQRFLEEAGEFARVWPRKSGFALVEARDNEWCASMVLKVYTDVFRPFLQDTSK